MPLGCWLSLVPTTDQVPCSSSPVSPSSSSSSSTTTTTSPTRSSDSYESTSSSTNSLTTPTSTTFHPSSCFIPFKKASTPHQQHKHDHHPTPNSFLKPMVLESPNSCRPRRNKPSPSSSSSSSPSLTSFHPLPLLENSHNQTSNLINNLNQKHTRSCFEVRSLQVCDIEKVRELHCATLPVTYPSSFFYNLLRSDSQEKISLVATLPSTSVQGYFEVLSSLGNHPGSQLVSSSTHHGHLSHHHVTSPLSGRKPISLDVVGTITARIAPGPSGPSVRILTLCVSPSYRRFGVGRLLLDSLLKQIKNRFSRLLPLSNSPNQDRIIVNLHVQATNKVAYAFYLRAGFSPVCFKPAYYSDNELKALDPALKKLSSSSSLSSLHKSSSLDFSSPLPSSTPSTHQQTLLSEPDPPSTTVTSDASDQTVDVDAWFLELSLDRS
ncbi:hypothetical protein PGTUg99_009101 [Puccinia graminis f. sp. tritici]|uniref:N-alpha-acetyltransferase 60 n=1 Tax=Puccinia graminis f. sp. tritici TaxID=56615 RepID=A0A5B0RTR9_PUCGR|nr:hypothetical protein PGTUg99_009101 [Puccinia graminis f. sp. tritici]